MSNRPTKFVPHRRAHTAESIARVARDPMCYPQLDPRKDFEPELTYAQRLRGYIEFVVNDETLLHEDPTVVIIY